MSSIIIEQMALVLIDLQNDFLPPFGSLAVPNGRDILPVVQQVLHFNWKLIVVSQDYHPPGHISFASTHHQEAQFPPNIDPNSGISLWPDHCVEGTHGSEVEASVKSLLLKTKQPVYFVKKGEEIDKENFSAFDSSSGLLDQYLKSQGISQIICLGLAADYCVHATVKSALNLGYQVFWLQEGIQAVGGIKVQNEVETKLVKDYSKHNFQIVHLEDVQNWFS